MGGNGKSELIAVHPVLAARDVSSSVEFYRRLGFELIFLDSTSEPRYAVVARDGVELHLQWATPQQWAAGLDRPVYRFLVQDVDRLFREFTEAGCAGSGGAGESPWAVPATTPWGTREFHLRDPGGNGLQFYRPLSGGGDDGS